VKPGDYVCTAAGTPGIARRISQSGEWVAVVWKDMQGEDVVRADKVCVIGAGHYSELMQQEEIL
jgi:hypothetical protein